MVSVLKPIELKISTPKLSLPNSMLRPSCRKFYGLFFQGLISATLFPKRSFKNSAKNSISSSIGMFLWAPPENFQNVTQENPRNIPPANIFLISNVLVQFNNGILLLKYRIVLKHFFLRLSSLRKLSGTFFEFIFLRRVPTDKSFESVLLKMLLLSMDSYNALNNFSRFISNIDCLKNIREEL